MKKKLVYLLTASILNILGFYFLSPETFMVCVNSCFTNPVTFGVGQPLFFGMVPVTLTFLIFLFIQNERIHKVYKLSVPYFLASIFLIYFIPLDCNALDPICITKSTVAIFLGLLFFIFSMIKIFKKPTF